MAYLDGRVRVGRQAQAMTYQCAVLHRGDTWFAVFIDRWLLLQEQALYEREGLKVKKIHYTDNQDCIGLTFLCRLLLLATSIFIFQ